MTTFTTQDRIDAMKAYEEVHFGDQYILRWVREGNEYVNSLTQDMIDELKAVVQQQQLKLTKYELRHAEQRDRIASLESQVYGGTTK